MFLSVHTCAGAIIGRFSPNPIVAFIIGVVSHFIMDLIPHGDLKVYDSYKKGKFVRHALAIVLLDGICSIYIAMLMLFGGHNFNIELSIVMGIAGATIPDVLTMIYELTKIKSLKWLHSFHFYVHRLIADKKEVSYAFGVFYQIILLFGLIVYTQTF